MSLSTDAQNWLQSVSGFAVDTGNTYNIDPSVILGQAALESGYGQSGAATQYNNLFGVKGAGDAGSVSLWTNEKIGGVLQRVKQNFAVYSSPQASFDAYGKLLSTSSRYANVIGADPSAAISALAGSGYATAGQSTYQAGLTGAVNNVVKSGVLNNAAKSLASKAKSLLGTATVTGLNSVIPGSGDIVAGITGIGGQKSWLQQLEDWISNSHFFERLAIGFIAFIFIFAAFYLLGTGSVQKLIESKA